MSAKLIAYGISHPTVKSLISYLKHLKLHVKIGSDTSDWINFLEGIPQISILEPSLLNLLLTT